MGTTGPQTLGYCPCGAALVLTTVELWICPRCWLGLTPGTDGRVAGLPAVLTLTTPGGCA